MKTALGKGLDALIPKGTKADTHEIEIQRILPGKTQPRKVFREEPLKELAKSIKEKGVLQPIIVAREGAGSFRLIAGERRLRACRLAGLTKIPAILRESDLKDSLEVALIENIQREDLDPIETAQGFQRLMKEYKLTQEGLSEKVGKERATVANYLRLLKLPGEVKAMLSEGSLSMGHAKALLSVDDPKVQARAAKAVASKGLSVRDTEAFVKKLSTAGHAKGKQPSNKPGKDPDTVALEDKLTRHLGTKVKILHKGKKGKIEIEYTSLAELTRLLDTLL